MSEYGMYGDRQDEFAALSASGQDEIRAYCHNMALMMNAARGMATGPVSERLTVVFRAEGIDGLQRATVELINGYSTRDDVEKIIAIRRGVKPDGITIYSMATI